MSDPQQQFNILFMSKDPDDQYSLQALLRAEGYQFYGRRTRERAAQLMSVYVMDLIIVDQDLDESSGIAYAQFLRNTTYARYVPIIVIGNDDEHGTQTVAAYDAGADDFVVKPFVFGVCLAKLKYHLRSRARRQAVSSSMSVNVSSGELPGVLQFLEVEQKTGKLTIKSDAGTAVLTLDMGKLVNATAPKCTGPDVVIEILCWNTSSVIFQDSQLTDEDHVIDFQITHVLMNSAVEVDEFRAMQKKLPAADVIFAPGPNELPKDSDEHRVKVHHRALEGFGRDELVQDSGMTERQATVALLGLINQNCLTVTDPPYADYTRRCYLTYRDRSSDKKLELIRDDLASVEFPLPKADKPPATLDMEWPTPAPMILVAGNKPQHGALLIESIKRIFEGSTGHLAGHRKQLGGIVHDRLHYPTRRFLDLVLLPGSLERSHLAWLDTHLPQVVGVIIVASDQDRFSIAQLMRQVRLLRQRFQGVCYHVVPRLIDDGVAIFKMDCAKCGYKLAVDIDGVGDTGICPICNAEIIMPDCLDNLARVLHLPRQVPVVQAQPDDPRHARDLLVLVLDTIIYSTQHAEEATGSSKRLQPPPAADQLAAPETVIE